MNVFVVRQPVFNRHTDVVAYELIIRHYDQYCAHDERPESVFTYIDINKLANHRRVFVRYCADLLTPEVALKLPRNLIGVEVRTTDAEPEGLLQICTRLKDLGYMVVAGEFAGDPGYDAVIGLADAVKVNYSGKCDAICKSLVSQNARVSCWAAEVNDNEAFQQALNGGFSYIQGRYFLQPAAVPTKDINISRGNYMRIFGELTQPEIDFGRLETVVQHDVAFCYKLLKFVNSAAFGFRDPIRSIRQALVLLGKKEVMHWVTSLTLREAADKKPQELIALSVARGKFAELLAAKSGLNSRATDAFLLGIFSLIDVLLNRPLKDILAELPLPTDLAAALMGEKSQLSSLYKLVVAYEKGDWDALTGYGEEFGLAEQDMPGAYTQALQWADEFIRM